MSGVEEGHSPFVPATSPEGRAKVFMHGGSQAVRLPKAFRVEGNEVAVRREGDRIILEPIRKKPPRTREEWAGFWERLDAMCDEPFPEITDRIELREINLDSDE
ncbi:MAG: SpoVT/AbrB domain protein [Caulobacteraceae bacterium]|nr:SpoVT/AbrB domain protein [Caulobacteraceae bacterium]